MEITSLNTSELIATIERSGISFMVLCLFLYALVRVGWWFGDRVIVPLVTAHTGFLNEVKSAVWDIAKSNVLINKNMEQLIDIQSENSENIKKIFKITNDLDRIISVVSEKNKKTKHKKNILTT